MEKSSYIANDEGLFEFLLEQGSDGKEYFSQGKAKPMVGDRLQATVRSIHRLQRLVSRLSQRIDPKILKFLIESGGTTVKMLRHRELLEERMEALSRTFEQATRVDETLSWSVHENEQEGVFWVQFQRRDHGKSVFSRLDKDLIGTAEFNEAQKLCVTLQNLVDEGACLVQGEKSGPSATSTTWPVS